MATFFSADLHLMHKNILKYCSRVHNGAIDRQQITELDVEMVAKKIVKDWNAVVNDNDIVYVLGDIVPFASRTKLKFAEPLLESLKGHKHLILGNHDTESSLFMEIAPKYFETIQQYLELELTVEEGTFNFVLFHYPIEDWNGKDKGWIHLHGHNHSNYFQQNIRDYYINQKGNRLEVGIDSQFNNIEFYPINYTAEQSSDLYKNNYNNYHLYSPINVEKIIEFLTLIKLRHKV